MPVIVSSWRRASCRCLLLVLFLLLASRAFAQPSADAALSGVVRDSTGAVIPHATVIVRAQGYALERIVESGGDGRFDVAGLPEGRLQVTVIAPGFAVATEVVEVPSDRPLLFTLRPAAVVEQVRVVSAARQEELRESLNTRVDVITRQRIEDTGAETVGEVLREVPGVLTRRGSEGTGPAGEQIQGIDSRQVLVLIDGQPLPGARGIKRGGVLNLDRQTTGTLERIEVVKGAASALYGSDALGGVINLITRESQVPFEVRASISGGEWGDFNGRTDVGARRGRWSGLFSAGRHQRDSFDLTPTTFDTTGASFRRWDALAKSRIQVSPSLGAGVMVNGYTNRSRGNSIGELGPQQDDIRDRTLNISGTMDWLITPTATFQVRGYGAFFDERSAGRLAPPQVTELEPGALDEDLAKVDASFGRVIGTRQQLQAGVEWSWNRYAGVNRIAFDDVDATTSVVWAQHRYSLHERLTTTIGARLDAHSTFGNALSPKVGANVRLTDTMSLRASYGRGFRAPDLGQLYYRFMNPTSFYQVIGNPNLRPEYANSYQFGGEFASSSRRMRAGVNVFYNEVRRLIESVSLGMVVTQAQLDALLRREGLDPSFRPVLGRLLFTYKNVNAAMTRGLEVDGDAAVTSSVSLGGAYTYLQAEDTETGLTLTGRHRHHGHIRASWNPGTIGLRANIRGTFYSSWIASRATSGNQVSDTVAPRFALWDAYVSQRLTRGLSAYVAIENLTDNQDPNTGVLMPDGTPAPLYRAEIGRTARFGVRWTFQNR
jgi:outer membrane receptor for ferrienterochelin and colicins